MSLLWVSISRTRVGQWQPQVQLAKQNCRRSLQMIINVLLQYLWSHRAQTYRFSLRKLLKRYIMLYPLIQFHRTSIIKSVVEKEKKRKKPFWFILCNWNFATLMNPNVNIWDAENLICNCQRVATHNLITDGF